jgi:hypothetical protein
LNVLPRIVELLALCEEVHYCDEEASFPQSTLQVDFSIADPTDISEPPDKNIE